MNYEKFPFGKYKGHLLNDLPNTYIVYALETFDLPEDLKNQLQEILIANLGIEQPMGVSLDRIEKIYQELSLYFSWQEPNEHAYYDALEKFRIALVMAS
jgi:uncharacterized protein (DUF3820 family)